MPYAFFIVFNNARTEGRKDRRKEKGVDLTVEILIVWVSFACNARVHCDQDCSGVAGNILLKDFRGGYHDDVERALIQH